MHPPMRYSARNSVDFPQPVRPATPTCGQEEWQQLRCSTPVFTTKVVATGPCFAVARHQHRNHLVQHDYGSQPLLAARPTLAASPSRAPAR